MSRARRYAIVIITLIVTAGWGNGVVRAADDATTQQNLNDLKNQINTKQQRYDDLQSQINVYKQNLESKQQEALTLNSQIEVIDQDIALNQAEIDQTQTQIESLDLQISELELKITQTQNDITAKDSQIGNLIVDLYNYDQQTYLEIALSHDTLSDFSDQVEYTDKLNTKLTDTLTDLKDLKDQFKLQKNDLQDKQQQAVDKKSELAVRQTNLSGEKEYKNNLLAEVEDDEAKFQQLVDQVKSEQNSVNAQILDLEKSARATLNKLNQGQGNANTNGGGTTIDLPNDFNPDWPVRGVITTYFHDPNYPFRRYFEHNAIDIAVPQSTPIHAADSGVVAAIKFDGTSNYAYVMIAHADNFATVYGHVSAVYVQTGDVVQKGQTIAASGGFPGSPGAGSYTTGAHLHFQVMIGGIAVDPLVYLP